VDIQVTIGNTEEIIQAVRSNKLDVGLIEGETQVPDLVVTPYMKDEMIMIAPFDHPLSSNRIIETDRLQNQIWVLRESGSGTRAFSDQFIQDTAIVMKRAYVMNSSQSIKEAVAAGLGVAMLSRWTVRKELEAGEIVELRIKRARLERDFSIIRHTKSPASMAVDMLVHKLLGAEPYQADELN
jgi:DNA-binding transcriptional LysR family regulator